jgi:AmmeMemoRadiSam system protein B
MISRRPPSVAGYFYKEHPQELRKEVENLLHRASVQKPRGSLRALIAPHAGYRYSGLTAAYGYRLLQGLKFDTVIIVGPSHREYFDGISIYPGDSYVTPLGEVPIDTEVRGEIIRQGKGVLLSDVGHRLEHSIEVQLPFLQFVLSDVQFVPIVMGDQHRLFCLALSEVISNVCRGREALLVASTDLSHYHEYDVAVQLDKRVVDCVEHYDVETLSAKLEAEEVEACGGGPMVTVMMASKALGANTSMILHHCNSGDVTDNRETVVGYLSAALLQVH